MRSISKNEMPVHFYDNFGRRYNQRSTVYDVDYVLVPNDILSKVKLSFLIASSG